jgi:hypothetical protein
MINILQTQTNKYIHPFKIDYKSDATTVSAAINFNSFLYTSPSSSNGKFSKFAIKDLTTIKTFTINSLSNPMYAILEIGVQSLKPQSASIVWSSNIKIEAVELDSNKSQTKARILIGGIKYDDKYTSLFKSDGINLVYVEQLINTNLILANMLFNGIPCVLPVPFSSIPIS